MRKFYNSVISDFKNRMNITLSKKEQEIDEEIVDQMVKKLKHKM